MVQLIKYVFFPLAIVKPLLTANLQAVDKEEHTDSSRSCNKQGSLRAKDSAQGE